MGCNGDQVFFCPILCILKELSWVRSPLIERVTVNTCRFFRVLNLCCFFPNGRFLERVLGVNWELISLVYAKLFFRVYVKLEL